MHKRSFLIAAAGAALLTAHTTARSEAKRPGYPARTTGRAACSQSAGSRNSSNAASATAWRSAGWSSPTDRNVTASTRPEGLFGCRLRARRRREAGILATADRERHPADQRLVRAKARGSCAWMPAAPLRFGRDDSRLDALVVQAAPSDATSLATQRGSAFIRNRRMRAATSSTFSSRAKWPASSMCTSALGTSRW